MKRIVDLRSDTLTKPSPEMREIMAGAQVGDDVYLEDPTVNKLQKMAAELTGHEDSLYFPSGCMANQVAIKIHTHHGQEVICEALGHVYNYEMATMAAISGVLARPVPGDNGFLTKELVAANIRPREYHRAQTGLICLENTHNLQGGRVHPAGQVKEIIEYAHSMDLPVHLDGARVFNAAIASGVAVKELTASYDSVMFCLSKGLGAPIGSMLCGSKTFVDQARIMRKLFGGGMRQVGILAEAGIYALENNVERLADDHRRAKILASKLNEIPFVSIAEDQVETNILVFEIDDQVMNAFDFAASLKEEGVICGPFSNKVVRMVTHLDISDDDIEYTLTTLEKKFQ